MKKNGEKMFVVRKYIKATSAAHAIRKDKTSPVDDVWIDEDWKKNNPQNTTAIGFSVNTKENDGI